MTALRDNKILQNSNKRTIELINNYYDKVKQITVEYQEQLYKAEEETYKIMLDVLEDKNNYFMSTYKERMAFLRLFKSMFEMCGPHGVGGTVMALEDITNIMVSGDDNFPMWHTLREQAQSMLTLEGKEKIEMTLSMGKMVKGLFLDVDRRLDKFCSENEIPILGDDYFERQVDNADIFDVMYRNMLKKYIEDGGEGTYTGKETLKDG